MIIVIGVLASAVLLVLAAFFSAAETSLVRLSPQKVKTLALKSPTLIQELSSWLKSPQELLTLILIGTTLVGVMFATVVSAVIIRLFHQLSHLQAEILSWLVASFFLVNIGEMAPKFYARENPEKTSLFVLPWIIKMRTFVAPFLRGFLRFLGLFFDRWKAPPVAPILTFSMEELKSLLDGETKLSDVPTESIGMMQRVLEINDRRAEAIMTPLDRIDLIEIDPPGKKVRDRDLLLDLIVENGHTRTPVKKGGRIIGFVHSSDLLQLMNQDAGQDVISFVRQAIDVRLDKRVDDLLRDFQTSGIYVGFVRNENQDVIGLVTLEDVLEEITGEILDEYDISRQTNQVSP